MDSHNANNTAAVLDAATNTLIESVRFKNTADGYAAEDHPTGFPTMRLALAG